jgi:hypothetical protein
MHKSWHAIQTTRVLTLCHVCVQPTHETNTRTVAEVVYSLLDWSTRHKAHQTATNGVWDFGKSLLDADNNLGNFGELEKLLDIHRAETVLKVDCCRNMCVAFWDPTHPTLRADLSLRNAHRTTCPVCGQARYVHGTKTPVRVFWYLPIKFWLQDLFAKGDLVPHLSNDLDPKSFPDGHVRRYGAHDPDTQ